MVQKHKEKYLSIRLIKRVGLPKLFINFVMQFLLMQNYRCNYLVNYASTIIFPQNIFVTKDLVTLTSFAVSPGCYFQAYNGIYAGSNFLFAPGVKIISSNHDFSGNRKALKGPPIIIGSNVWLGANAIILPGVQLGDNCIVGAGSIVTKSFPEKNLILAGNPARIIKKTETEK